MKIFSWLILIFLFLISNHFWVSGKCLKDQKSLLLQFRSELTYSNTSTKLIHWRSSADCCQWEGIDCDSSGHIIALELDNESIYGRIENPSSLFSLQYLRKLNLAYNSFNSTIEILKGLSNLTHLQYLNLSNAGFGGQIPIELSEMKSLAQIDFSSQFQFATPLKLTNPNLKSFVQNLIGIQVLNLDRVNVSDQGNGWWEAVSSLPKLQNLSLRYCKLSLNLDTSFPRLPFLSVLHLDGNDLSATNPAHFTNFKKLSILTLSSCSLQGHFPEAIFQVATLQYLDLSNNMNLTGTIPVFPRSGSFKTIALSNTSFSGSLPNSIGSLRMLSIIDLSNCNFSGSIPSEIANLSKLANLDLSFNRFNGSIPVLGTLENLVYIDLSHNGLTGNLSDTHFADLSNLSNMNLGDNLITGNIPRSLFNLPSLQKLILSNNKFSGQVSEVPNPNSLNLNTLDLSSNLLEGSLPEFFFSITRLNVLSLSYNRFNGTMALEKIQRLHNLTNLNLAYNNLSIIVNSSHSEFSAYPNLTSLNLASCNLSVFPNLRNQTRMTNLDLSNNKIQGQLPRWIWQIGNGTLNQLNLSCNSLVNLEIPFNISKRLSLLDLHSNNLQGKMPVPPQSAIYVDYSSNKFTGPIDIGNSTAALFFSAANNILTGGIPMSFCNASVLQVLDLSGNSLNGSIPPCLLNNTETLGVLNLGRNKISGDIPDTFSVSCALKTLDLSRNNIQGEIPASLANCKSIEVMNVGNNHIRGPFPCILKNSPNLRVLVLRSNEFKGNINCSEADQSWTNLQIIDIAANRFNGYLNSTGILRCKGMMLDRYATQNHLKFKVLSNSYYQDRVTVTLKGLEVELQKILTLFTSIDISSNNFEGTIPEIIGQLSSLYVLNLSHNSFEGIIPRSIRNLIELESLDLSSNRLTGPIPQELSRLTFLSVLNFSYNNLTGMIPISTQLLTFSAASFEGNPYLCGPPLRLCTVQENGQPESTEHMPSEKGFDWQFIFTGLGAGAGAALVIAPLVFCKILREQCDNHLDHFLKLNYPGYGFNYARCYGKVDALKKIEDETTDSNDDDTGEIGDKYSLGRYCVFCTKIDMQMTTAFHNPQCTCYYKPPKFFSSDSSSSSLLLVYSQRF